MSSLLANKLRCPYCLEEEDYLEGAKVLSCNHMYCTPCIEGFSIKKESKIELTCCVCSKTHQLNSFEELKSHKSTADDENPGTQPQSLTDTCTMKCDRCKEQVDAVCYCEDCDRRLCKKHEVMHQDYFLEEEHKLISADVFKAKQRFFTKTYCERHTKECYSMGCEKCFSLRCAKCRDIGSCTDKHHNYQPLAELSERIKCEFEELLKKCSERVTEMCRLEKQSWMALDRLEEQCQQLDKQVETKTLKLIEVINKEARLVRDKIVKFLTLHKRGVESFLETARDKREHLENHRSAAEEFMQNNSRVDMVRNYEENRNQLQKEISHCVELYNWEQAVDPTQGMLDRFLRCTISLEQNMIEFIAEHPTSIKCCSTHHMENGRLLVAGYEGISEIIHFEDKFKDSLTESAGIVTSITHDAVNSYCLTHFGKNKTVSQCVTPHDFDDLEPLISLEHEPNSASFLAILPSRRIAVTDEKSLIIYDVVNRKQTCHNISYSAHGLMSLPGEEKLILTASDKIFCYEIPTHGDIEMIWMCECGSNISGVCNMGFGQIALPVAFEDRLYVVDAENGEILRMLRHEKLVEYKGGQFSMYEGSLAIPSWDNNNVLLFKVYR